MQVKEEAGSLEAMLTANATSVLGRHASAREPPSGVRSGLELPWQER